MEPTGLMVCLKCECLQVEKKGIIQTKGETVCRNIKHRCPDVTCSNPRTLPGRCCKICSPEDDFEATLSFREERPPLHPPEHLPSDDSVRYTGNNVYSSLMTLATSGNPTKVTSSLTPVADLRLTMTPGKGQLDFSLRLSAALGQSTSFLQLLDEHGEVQLKHELGKSVKRERTICGTWNEVPSVYKSYMDNGQMTARILFMEHSVISGKITTDPGSHEELFSGVLHPSKSNGSGGKVKVVYNPTTDVAKFKVTTKGLEFDAANKATFRLAVMHKSRTIFLSPQLTLSKFNQLEAPWRMRRKRHRRLMARGKLRMRVLKDGTQQKMLLEGSLLSRLSCDVYQAVATRPDMTQKSSSGSPVVTSAVVTVGDKGWLGFQLKVDGVSHTFLRRIILEGSRPNHKRHVIWKKSSQLRPASEEENKDGMISGRYTKLDMGSLYRLRQNRMYLTIMFKNNFKVKATLVSTETGLASIEGKTNWINLPPSIDKHGRVDKVTTQLQLSVRPDCSLQFVALVKSPDVKKAEVDIHLSIAGSDDSRSSKVKDEWRAVIEKSKFVRDYQVVDGQYIELPGVALLALDRGYAYLWVTLRDVSKDQPVVSTRRTQTRVPNQCWRLSGSDLKTSLQQHQQLQQQLRDEGSFEEQKDPTAAHEEQGINGEEEPPPTCMFEGQVYQEGSAWLPDVNARCNTCSCVKGEVMCPRMICPELSCSNPVQVDGECCPSCPAEASIETCQLGQDPRTYRLHSTWHPYLPLEGFTRCAICTCLPGGRSVCSKTECPALPCDRSRWVKSKTNPCCHECAAPEPDDDEEFTYSLQQDIDMEGACFDRGQIRRNGETWHPTIQTFGFMKCIQCHCADGSFKCEFLKCPKLSCTRKRKIPNVCCEVCEDESPNTVKVLAAPEKQKAVATKVQKKAKTKKKRKACKVDNRQYIHGEKWRPQTVDLYDNCAVCRCQNGKAKCRMRCPKTCETDAKSHRCCKHCNVKLPVDGKVTNRKKASPAVDSPNPAGKITSVFEEKINLIKFLRS